MEEGRGRTDRRTDERTDILCIQVQREGAVQWPPHPRLADGGREGGREEGIILLVSVRSPLREEKKSRCCCCCCCRRRSLVNPAQFWRAKAAADPGPIPGRGRETIQSVARLENRARSRREDLDS